MTAFTNVDHFASAGKMIFRFVSRDFAAMTGERRAALQQEVK